MYNNPPFNGMQIWVGRETGTWIITAFESEAHALGWASAPPTEQGRFRQVWRATLDQVVPLKLIPPGKPRFEDDLPVAVSSADK